MFQVWIPLSCIICMHWNLLCYFKICESMKSGSSLCMLVCSAHNMLWWINETLCGEYFCAFWKHDSHKNLYHECIQYVLQSCFSHCQTGFECWLLSWHLCSVLYWWVWHSTSPLYCLGSSVLVLGQGLGKSPSSASQHATTNQPSVAGLQELVRK